MKAIVHHALNLEFESPMARPASGLSAVLCYRRGERTGR